MGLFDSSSRSSSSTDANTTGSQSQSGGAASVNADAGGNQSIAVTNNTTYTDLGVVQAGQNLAGAALDTASNMVGRGLATVSEGIYSNESSLNSIISMGERVMDGAAGLVRDAMREMSFAQENALAAAAEGMAQGAAMTRDAIDSNTIVTRDALSLSQSVVHLTDDLHTTNTQFLTGALNEYTGSMSDTVARLDNSRNQESAANLEAITELATVVQTGGESINANVNKMIAGLAIAVAGLIAWRALG